MDLGGAIIGLNFAESCCFKAKQVKRGIDIHDSPCMGIPNNTCLGNLHLPTVSNIDTM